MKDGCSMKYYQQYGLHAAAQNFKFEALNVALWIAQSRNDADQTANGYQSIYKCHYKVHFFCSKEKILPDI